MATQFFSAAEIRELESWPVEVGRDEVARCFRLAAEDVASHEVRVIRPGVVSLMEEIAAARQEADREVHRRLAPLFTPQRVADLDDILEVQPEMTVTRLVWLHRGSTTYSPTAIKAEADKIRFLRGLDAHTLDLSTVPESRRRQLAGLGRRLRPQALRGRHPASKYPILLATLAECHVEVLDEITQMFDQALSRIESRAKNKVKEKLAQRARSQWTSWTCWRRRWPSPPTWRSRPSEWGHCGGRASEWTGCAPRGGIRRTGPTGTTVTWMWWRTPSRTCGNSPRPS